MTKINLIADSWYPLLFVISFDLTSHFILKIGCHRCRVEGDR